MLFCLFSMNGVASSFQFIDDEEEFVGNDSILSDSTTVRRLPARQMQIEEREQLTVQPPSAASLMKAIDNPVGLYNGNPSISHNIYTLTDGQITLPIDLTYNASGIKVNEEASWVGMGWNLNVGGMITKSIVGKEDLPNAYKVDLDYYPPGEYPSYYGKQYRTNDKSTHDMFFQYATQGHLQPDVYYYQFPGGSGKFFIDHRNDSIYLMDDERALKIEAYNYFNSRPTAWSITTEDGTQHWFDSEMYSENQAATTDIISRSYVLKFTRLPNGQEIDYNYTYFDCYRPQHSENANKRITSSAGLRTSGINDSEIHTYDNLCYTQEAVLSQIKTSNYFIDFYTSLREDYQNGRKLDEIDIYPKSGSQKHKKFRFDSSYITSNENGNHWAITSRLDAPVDTMQFRKRLFLNSVYETNEAGISKDKLEFTYYQPEKLPAKNSFAVDYWGYYNGQINNKGMIPDNLSLFGDGSIAESYYYASKTGNRLVCLELGYCGMLKEIKYETGGSTEFIYEPHTYGSSKIVSVVREAKTVDDYVLKGRIYDKNQVNNPTSINVTGLKKDNMILIDMHITKGQGNWSDICNSVCAIISDGGSVTSFNDLLPTDTTSLHNRKWLKMKVPRDGSYRIAVNIPNGIGDQSQMWSNHALIEATIYIDTIPYPEDNRQDYNYGGGFRVKRVNHYDNYSSHSLARSITYDYQNNSGTLVVPLQYHREYSSLTYAQKFVNSLLEPPYVDWVYVSGLKELYLSDHNLFSAPYSTVGTTVTYPEVKVTECMNNGAVGYSIHSFHNTIESSYIGSYQLVSSMRGKPISTEYYDKNGSLVSRESYSYSGSRSHFYRGVSITDHFNRSSEFYTSAPGSSPSFFLIDFNDGLLDYGDYDGRYEITFYPIVSERNLLTGKTTTVDNVSTRENYTYNDYCLMTKKSIINSNGEEQALVTHYPNEYSSETLSNMTQRHFLAYPVEIFETNNGRIVNGRYTEYEEYGSTLMTYFPKADYKLSLASPLYESTWSASSAIPESALYPYASYKVLEFDWKGNPLYIKKDGIETTYIWSYGGQFPIAEIKGASIESVESNIGNALSLVSNQHNPDYTRINALRNSLPKAQITTYEWEPLCGIKKITSPNGNFSTYEYDTFGRLLRIKDHQGNLLQRFEYNYAH